MRLLVVCPGRGSYTPDSLGTLTGRSPRAQAIIDACDAVHEPPISQLDAEPRFRGTLHLAGEHASLLTFAASMADHVELSDRWQVVGAIGNSMGWYTALAVAGALPLPDAITLVQTMGSYQTANVIGGQILYPTYGPDWLPDPTAEATVDAALARTGAHRSIRLGGVAVLAGDEHTLPALIDALPHIERGGRTFPLKLPLHSAFHTPLMTDTAARAARDLARLAWRAPDVPLVDGHGRCHPPRWTAPAALRDYTLGAQVTDTFDLDAALQTALSHCAPDAIALLGPGNSLGGPIARLLVRLGYNGIRSKADFESRQSEELPLLLSFARPEQRALLV